MRVFSHIRALIIAVAVMAGMAVPAPAAELRISLAELARIVNTALSGSKLRLHNVPGGIFNLTPGSSLSFGTTTVPITIPARTFVVGGTTYAYYINDLNSKQIAVSAVSSALRFTITFDDAGPEMIGKCVSGFCVSDTLLPEIQWRSPVVTIDLAPVSSGGSISLVAKRVDVGGSFAPDCDLAQGIFAGPLCKLVVLPQARKATANLKSDLNNELMKQINALDLQAKLSATLSAQLKFGPAGSVSFTKVAVEPDNVVLSFCLSCQTQ